MRSSKDFLFFLIYETRHYSRVWGIWPDQGHIVNRNRNSRTSATPIDNKLKFLVKLPFFADPSEGDHLESKRNKKKFISDINVIYNSEISEISWV